MNRLVLENLRFHAYHGKYDEENRIGNTFSIDVELKMDYSRVVISDDEKDTIDYAEVYQNIRGIMEGNPYNLIEALAHAIAQDLLNNFPVLDAVSLRVSKLQPPIGGLCARSYFDYTLQR